MMSWNNVQNTSANNQSWDLVRIHWNLSILGIGCFLRLNVDRGELYVKIMQENTIFQYNFYYSRLPEIIGQIINKN